MKGVKDTAPILVVDDEPDAIDLCRRVLRDYEVIVARSGGEALEAVRGRSISVALVDQRMPTMTGLELLVDLGKSHPDAARIVMTAYTELDDIVALINEGRIHAFVVKPWNNHQMRLTVEREIENVRQAVEIRQLNERLRREHGDMRTLLEALDPSFKIPQSSLELNRVKHELRARVAGEVERLFLQQLLSGDDGEERRNISAAARAAKINRTFLYRLLERHGLRQAAGGERPR